MLSCCCKWQNGLSFCGWLVFHCVCVRILTHSRRWALRLLPYLDSCNNGTVNTGVHVSFQIHVFVASGYRPRSEMLVHMVVLFLVFWLKKFLLLFLTLKYVLLLINLLSLLTRDTLLLLLSLSCSQNLSLTDFLRTNRCFQLWSNTQNRKLTF